MPKNYLMDPIKINTITAANRSYMPSMLTNFAAINGEVTERSIHYYEERAQGGVGIITVEGTAISPEAKPFIRGLSIADTQKLKGLSKLAKAIKRHGTKASIQLIHGGRCINPTISGYPTPQVSYVPQFCNYNESIVLDIDDIAKIIDDFAQAAARAQEAGFDLIELHGAHGYLINQFISPLTNQRTDEYGGDVLQRALFSTRVIQAVRAAVGPDFPIVYRHSAEDGLAGGLTLADTLKIVNPLIDAGADALHISCGMPETKHWISPPPCMEQGWKVDLAYAVKTHIQNRVPVISVGRFTKPAFADEMIQEGKTDMVAFGRALIADSFLLKKYFAKKSEEMTLCLSCNEGCTGRTGKLLDIACAVNPRVGLENKYPRHQKAKQVLSVAIIGGGAAGLQAAISAAELGHNVTIFEARSKLGGLLNAAAKPPFKIELAEYLLSQIYEIQENNNITVVYNKEVEAKDLDSFDRIILASGSKPTMPAFTQCIPNAVSAEDVLLGNKLCGERVLIIGGGMVGCETAEFLASQGKHVTILEKLPDIAIEMEWRAKHTLQIRLKEYSVAFFLQAEFVSADTDGTIHFKDKYGKASILDAFDTVIIAIGYTPSKELLPMLESLGKPLVSIGDCLKAGKIIDAVQGGFMVAQVL